MHLRFNCGRRFWQILTLSAHDAAGGTILDGPYPDDTPASPEPNTPATDLLDQYCPH